MEWLAPWHSVTDDAKQVVGMEAELKRELSSGHPLYQLPIRTLGRRQDCDDVLFALDDGTCRVAVVHLTWTHNPPEQYPWPNAVLYADLETWATQCMKLDHEEFSA